MAQNLTVVVTGSTGKQGGAVAFHSFESWAKTQDWSALHA